eukprot:COSAG02_NODE_4996_length_4738_cov_2.522526_1_plen_82_part_00
MTDLGRVLDGSGESAWTLASPSEDSLAALETAHLLLHLCLFRAFQVEPGDFRYNFPDGHYGLFVQPVERLFDIKMGISAEN